MSFLEICGLLLIFPCISGCMVKNHQTDSSDQPSQPDWYPLLEITTQAIPTLGLLKTRQGSLIGNRQTHPVVTPPLRKIHQFLSTT